VTTRHAIANEALAPQVPHEIAVLLAALQFRGANTEALQKLSETEWNSLLHFCDLAHLTLPLAQLTLNSIPAWVTRRLEANLTDNALRFKRVQDTYCEAANAFERAGVEHIVMKGFTQAPDYVTHPRLRVQSDFDLFCPPEQIPQAQSALESIGYRPYAQADFLNADHTPPMVRLGDWTWQGNAFDPNMPLSIELHFCLWNEHVSLFSTPETEQFWERRISRSIDGMHFPALHPVDHLGHLALHILRNLSLREWIVHHVYELAFFLDLHADDDAFWSQWKSLHSDSLRAKQAIAFFHAATWFNCNLHPAVAEQIADLPERQRDWLHHFAWSSLEGIFYPNKDFTWLHLTLVEGSGRKRALLRRLFLPPATTRLDSPRVTTRNRRIVETTRHPWLRYVSYLSARTIFHSQTNLSALWRGLEWQISRHRLTQQFWPLHLLLSL
jgi:hypothetical protein